LDAWGGKAVAAGAPTPATTVIAPTAAIAASRFFMRYSFLVVADREITSRNGVWANRGERSNGGGGSRRHPLQMSGNVIVRPNS
jgi:hypothetical protein